MAEFCNCCGQEIANPIWDRAAEALAEADLRALLLAFLGPDWKVESDNGIYHRTDGTRLSVVVHANVRMGPHGRRREALA